MKLFKLAIGLLGLSLAACSSEDPQVPQEPGGEVAGGDSRYMSVTIRNANGGRAGGNQDGNLYEEGLSGENEITSVRFYFFNEAGDAVSVKSDGTNYYDCTEITSVGSNMPNVEKKLKAVIVINTKQGDNLNDLKKMVAVANLDLGDGSKSLSDLQIIHASYNANGETPYLVSSTLPDKMPMTSSVYGNGLYDIAAEILPQKIKQTPDDAEGDPVDVYIERIQAKVRAAFDWNDDFKKEGMTKSVTYKGKQYTAVKLYNRIKNAQGVVTKTEEIKVKVGEAEENVYAMFTGWCPTGVAKDSYAIKKFDATWDLGWTPLASSTLKRSFWAENSFADPSGDAKNTTLKYYAPTAAVGVFGTTPSVTGNTPADYSKYDGSFYYIQENAATPGQAGKKTAYNPETTLSNRTQVLFGARLVTIAQDGTVTPLALSEWGGTKYVGDADLIAAILNVFKTQIWIGKKNTEADKTTWTVRNLAPADVKLVSATDIAGDNLFDAQDDKRYLTYIQLNGNVLGSDEKFYKTKPVDENEPAAYTETEVNTLLRSIPGAKVWGDSTEGKDHKGMTYYYVDIIHQANAAENQGKHGVVRNHIYDIELNSVYGLGTPIYDPEDDTIIIPQKPNDDESYIGANINVLSWRVIRQNVSLDWD